MKVEKREVVNRDMGINIQMKDGIGDTSVPGANTLIARLREKSGRPIPKATTSPIIMADTKRGKSQATK
jgi:hypothetical protein